MSQAKQKKRITAEKWTYLPRRPRALICTKFGTAGLLEDLISLTIFLGISSGVLIVSGRILPFYYLQAVTTNTVRVLPRSV